MPDWVIHALLAAAAAGYTLAHTVVPGSGPNPRPRCHWPAPLPRAPYDQFLSIDYSPLLRDAHARWVREDQPVDTIGPVALDGARGREAIERERGGVAHGGGGRAQCLGEGQSARA